MSARQDIAPARLLPRMRAQAKLLSAGKAPISEQSIEPVIEQALEGLDQDLAAPLKTYIRQQWGELSNDALELIEDPNNEERGVTLATLRGRQIERKIVTAATRQRLSSAGEEFFVWSARMDAQTRDSHRALNGKLVSLAVGDPLEGYPGDAHGCRCVMKRVSKSRGDQDSYVPPKSVQAAAAAALEARASAPASKKGMTSVGLARARDLKNGRPISIDTIERMLSYFARHEIDKKGKTWSEKGKGWQAWHGWGGDEGYKWAQGILKKRGNMRTRYDALEFDLGRAITQDNGWLEVQGAVLARAGVLTYRLGNGNTTRELRDPEVIHAPAALESYDGKPIIIGHPTTAQGNTTLLTKKNTAKFKPVGSIRNPRADTAIDPNTGRSSAVTRADLLIWDERAIAAIRGGKRQLSCGYSVEIEAAPPGSTFQGEQYDSRQILDIGNHCAIVDHARAGKITEIRLDQHDGKSNGVIKTMAQVTINNVTGEVDPALIPLIQALKDQKQSASERADSVEISLEELKGELKVLKAAAVARGDEDQRINAAVNARLNLQRESAALLPSEYDFTNKSSEQIRNDAVINVAGVEGLEGAALEGAYRAALALKTTAAAAAQELAENTRRGRNDSAAPAADPYTKFLNDKFRK